MRKVACKIITVLLTLNAFITPTVLGTSGIKEILQDITLGRLDEVRTIEANEYLVYNFMGMQGEKISVSIEIINGGPADVLLMDSNGFANFQSAMLVGSAKVISSYNSGTGSNIKSKSYTFTFDHTDRYYIAIDNTIQGGSKPSGSIDVKIKIAKATSQIPGFKSIYSILFLIMTVYLQRKWKKK